MARCPRRRYLVNELTTREQELLTRHGEFYQKLASGLHVPTTDAQRRFVDVCRGIFAPETEHERAYMRSLAIEKEQERRAGDQRELEKRRRRRRRSASAEPAPNRDVAASKVEPSAASMQQRAKTSDRERLVAWSKGKRVRNEDEKRAPPGTIPPQPMQRVGEMAFPLRCQRCGSSFISPGGGVCRVCTHTLCGNCFASILRDPQDSCWHRRRDRGHLVRLDVSFDARERGLLSQNFHILLALYSGARAPRTAVEHHFLRAVKGECQPNSPLETGFLKLLDIEKSACGTAAVVPNSRSSKLVARLQSVAAAAQMQQPVERSSSGRSRVRVPDEVGPSIPEFEEGVPRPGWFTDEDWRKLHPGRR
jgi:uncharacterized protein YifE (UPF0438 family)